MLIRSITQFELAKEEDKVLKDNTLAESTRVNYATKIKKWLTWLEEEDLLDTAQITYDILFDWVTQLKEDGIKKIACFFAAIYNFLIEQEWITHDTYRLKKINAQVTKNFLEK